MTYNVFGGTLNFALSIYLWHISFPYQKKAADGDDDDF